MAVDFKPGSTRLSRFGTKSKLSAAVLALIAASAQAPQLLSQYLDEREAVVLHSYKDGKQIWTACRGLTRINGEPVRPGMNFTRAECDKYDEQELQATLAELQRIVAPQVYATLTEPAKAGIASFCTYNLGVDRCKGTTFLQLLNAGRRNEACAQITLWIRDGGKDCRVDKSCRGQVTRRQQEDELCMHGVTWGASP
jgi:lysozyme